MMPETTVSVATEQPKQPPKEGDKKKQTILWIILAVAVLILIGLGIYWYFYQRQGTVDQDADQQNENQNVEDETEEQYFEYVWYEDDYIRFMYPRGWEVTVDDGQIEAEGSFLDGVASITLVSSEQEYRVDFTLDAGGGDECSYIYDSNLPLMLNQHCIELGDSTGGDREVALASEPQRLDIEEYGLVFLCFSEVDNCLAGTEESGIWSSDGGWVEPTVPFDFLGGTGVWHDVDMDEWDDYFIISPSCPVSSDEEAYKCLEFIEVFFETVERLDAEEGWSSYLQTTGQRFRFNYPSDATLRSIESCSQEPEADVCDETRVTLQGYTYHTATLVINAAEIELNGSRFIEINSEAIKGYTWKNPPIESTVSLPGAEGIMISGVLEDAEEEDKYAAYVLLDGDEYYYTVYWWDEVDQPNQQIFETMLNSFVFSI